MNIWFYHSDDPPAILNASTKRFNVTFYFPITIISSITQFDKMPPL